VSQLSLARHCTEISPSSVIPSGTTTSRHCDNSATSLIQTQAISSSVAEVTHASAHRKSTPGAHSARTRTLSHAHTHAHATSSPTHLHSHSASHSSSASEPHTDPSQGHQGAPRAPTGVPSQPGSPSAEESHGPEDTAKAVLAASLPFVVSSSPSQASPLPECATFSGAVNHWAVERLKGAAEREL